MSTSHYKILTLGINSYLVQRKAFVSTRKPEIYITIGICITKEMKPFFYKIRIIVLYVIAQDTF